MFSYAHYIDLTVSCMLIQNSVPLNSLELNFRIAVQSRVTWRSVCLVQGVVHLTERIEQGCKSYFPNLGCKQCDSLIISLEA